MNLQKKNILQIFIVHNFITYITTRSIIEFYNFSKEDYLILTFRNFNAVDKNLNNISYPFSDYNSNELFPSKNFIKGWTQLFKFDKKVKKITTNRKFKLYLLGFANIRSFYAFKSHPKCIGYSYIEEGAVSFNKFDYFKYNYVIKYSLKYKLLNYLNFFGRINGNSFNFFYEDYLEAFCISSDAFTSWERKIVLPISNKFVSTKFETKINHIFVLEGLVKAGYGLKNDYFNFIDTFISYCTKNNINTVLYKHHPSIDFKDEIDNYLKNSQNVRFIKLSDKVSLEALALANKSLIFYGTISSILIYATVFGAKAISLAPVYENIIQKKFNNIPIILKKIESINF